jgi:hypothetical protein
MIVVESLSTTTLRARPSRLSFVFCALDVPRHDQQRRRSG